VGLGGLAVGNFAKNGKPKYAESCADKNFHPVMSDFALVLLLSITISARQPRRQRRPAEMKVAAKPAWLASAAPAAPVAAVPIPVDVE